MKINKVELKAFRAYQNLKDGTFDLHSQDGTPSNFVAIYAPNGFGKTSFFDGVEWCLTNNIQRFVRRSTENKKLAKTEQDVQKHKQYILRNKDSQEEDAFVKIESTNGEFFRELPKNITSGKRDFKFDVKDTEEANRHFLDVLLAQDWIDAFLKEEKADSRYEKFMNYFGEQNLDKQYDKIITLIKKNNSIIAQIKKDLKGVQQKLRLDLDSSVLINANNCVDTLRKSGESITEIDLGFTEVEKIKLFDKISNRKIELQSLIDQLEDQLKDFAIKLIELEEYIQTIGKQKELEKDIENLEKARNKFKDQNQLKNQLKNLKNKKTEIQDSIEKILKVKDLFSQVNRIQKDIEKRKQEVETNQKLCESVKHELDKDLRMLESKKSTSNRLLKEGHSLSENINNVDQDFTNLKNLDIENGKLQNEKKQKTSISQKAEVEISKLGSSIEKIKSAKRELDYGDLYSPLFSHQNILDKSDRYRSRFKEKESLLDELKNLEVKKTTIDSVNNEFKQFLNSGIEIINETKSCDCPLCNTKFNSYNSLLERVSENPFLNDLEKQLINDENKIQGQLKECKEQLEFLKKDILNHLNEIEKKETKEILSLEESISDTKISIAQIDEKEKINAKEIELLLAKTYSLPIDECKLRLKKEYDENSIALEKTISEVKDLESKVAESTSRLEIVEKLISDNKTLIEDLSNSSEIISFTNQCKALDIIVKSEKYIDFELNAKKKNQEELSIKEGEISGLVQESEKQLKSFDESKIDSDLSISQDELHKLKYKTGEFQKFLKDNSIDSDKDSELKKNLEIGEKNIVKLKKEKEKVIESYNKFIPLIENVLPYIEQKTLQKEESDLKEELNFRTETVSKELEKEKESISTHIGNRVESFFHKDLINQIYAKIDPHPIYKEIEFYCDFSGASPKLEVLVKIQGDENRISPALYFSTAQINVLSLSIFLAKAIHAQDQEGKPINCIFLDDPIQSMDSINILSTIDLLRSLSVNYDKQIILSTHEENFFKLLQRKIPSDRFSSKFLELETFGKVNEVK